MAVECNYDGGIERRRLASVYTNRRDITNLIKALGDQQDTNIRMSAAIALGSLQDMQAINPLVTALWDSNEDVRKTAAIPAHSLARALLGGDYILCERFAPPLGPDAGEMVGKIDTMSR